MTVQCCKCKKVKSSRGWARPAGVLDGDVSHTYCPVCFKQARAEIMEEIQWSRAPGVLLETRSY